MKIAEAVVWTILAILVAVVIERLVAHFCRRADEDTSRLDAAMAAMEDQKISIDALIARDTIPDTVKDTLLMFCEAALTKSGAHSLFRLVVGKQPDVPPETQIKVDEFNAATVRMQERDPEAYELYRTFIYRVPIMAILQRPETYKAMGQLSLRLAGEREPAAARDAALMTKGSTVLPAAA